MFSDATSNRTGIGAAAPSNATFMPARFYGTSVGPTLFASSVTVTADRVVEREDAIPREVEQMKNEVKPHLEIPANLLWKDWKDER